jgi:hypothetical protein
LNRGPAAPAALLNAACAELNRWRGQETAKLENQNSEIMGDASNFDFRLSSFVLS